MEFDASKVTITNDFMLATILSRHTDICRELLEAILRFEIKKVTYTQKQDVYDAYMESKGVRLDVVAREDGKVYDIEMQVANTDNIPKRSRYYQAQLDMGELPVGAHYSELPSTYIIFICEFDMFGEDRYVYTFEERCVEDMQIHLDDGTKKVYVNATGHVGQISKKLRDFVDYINDRNAAHNQNTSDYIKQIDKWLKYYLQDAEWRKAYMTLEMKELEIRMEARKEGKAEGIVEGEAIGEARGEAIGEARGILSTYINLVRDNLITKQEAAKRLGMSEEEFEKKLHESV